MATLTLREYLSRIRDGFRKIENMTRQLGAQPPQEALEEALRERDAVLCAEVDKKALELSAAYPDWRTRAQSDPALSGLVSESSELMRSVMIMDEHISFVVAQRMENIKYKLTSLYHTSRAANSYTRQSTMRVARISKN
jgi:hypothetical protein